MTGITTKSSGCISEYLVITTRKSVHLHQNSPKQTRHFNSTKLFLSVWDSIGLRNNSSAKTREDETLWSWFWRAHLRVFTRRVFSSNATHKWLKYRLSLIERIERAYRVRQHPPRVGKDSTYREVRWACVWHYCEQFTVFDCLRLWWAHCRYS